MVNKSDIVEFVNNTDLNKKIATLATKTELQTQPDKIAKLQAFDSSYFRVKMLFWKWENSKLFSVSADVQVF